MKRFAAAVLMCAVSLSPAFAEEARATPEEAKAMVKKAIVHYKKVGKQKALADFSRRDGGFVDRDVYVTVYTFEGLNLAHINPKFIGKIMLDLRDEKGKFHIKERVDRARTEESGWQDLAGRINPNTKAQEDKRMYFERYDSLVFASGAYKPR